MAGVIGIAAYRRFCHSSYSHGVILSLQRWFPYHETVIEAENMLVQLDVLRDLGVYEVLFWNGDDDIPNYDQTIVDRFRALIEVANTDS